jgi:hypothetical protein
MVFLQWSLFTSGVVSQVKPVEEWAERLDSILAIEDEHEQRYQLSLFNQQFSTGISHSINLSESYQGALKQVNTDDGLYRLFYYVLPESMGIQYHVFVCYQSEDDRTHVHHFTETVGNRRHVSEKLEKAEIRVTSYLLEGKKFTEVSFAEQGNPITWYKYADLETKCLFEEIGATDSDSIKLTRNKRILERLSTLWQSETHFEEGFASLDRMKTLFSSKKELKICTYGIPFSDFTNRFYGAVIARDKKNVKVFLLNDQTESIRSPERTGLDHKKWYGATYLDMVEVEYEKKKYYTLIGFKGHDGFVKTRVLDVLWFSGDKPRFGATIFKNDRVTYNRVIFKYAVGANMVLKYDADLKMIVMDNLTPSESYYKDVYRFYGPDFSYNAYEFEKGKWVLNKDIDLRNPM